LITLSYVSVHTYYIIREVNEEHEPLSA